MDNIRNIANVVHDLRPVVFYLKEKLAALKMTDDSSEIIELLSNLEQDSVMLELYLDALEKDAKSAEISKVNVTYK